MKTPDLIAALRSAAWPSPADVQRFVREVGPLPPSDLEKVLELMCVPELEQDRRSQDARRAALEGMVAATPQKEHFRPLVRALPTASEETRKVLVRLLPRVFEPTRLDDLLAHLKDPDNPQLRRATAEALSALGGLPVVQALTELVREPRCPGRREAMDVLVTLGGPRALSAVISALGADDPQVRVHALAHLQNPAVVGMKGQETLASIRAMFSDANDDVVVQAIRTYCALCTEEDFFGAVAVGIQSPKLPVVRAVVEGMRRFPSTRAMDALEWRFRQGPTAVRLVVLETAEEIQNDRVVPLLAEALAAQHLVVRRRAAEVLVRLGQSGRVDLRRTALWLLRNPDVNVRRMAVEMAAGIPDPQDELWPELLSALGDPDWWVRTRVVDALCVLAGRKLLARLPPLLPGAPPMLRIYAVEVLERLGDPEAVPTLVTLVEADGDELVRERAVEALGRIRHPSAEAALLAVLREKPDLHLGAVEALEALGARAAASDVALLLTSPDTDLRLATLSCLDTLDDPSQARFVERVADDPDPAVRRRARAMLGRWNTYGTLSTKLADDNTLDGLLERALNLEADLLTLAGGSPPLVRTQGQSQMLVEAVIAPEQVNRMIMPLLSSQQHQHFHAMEEVDLSYELKSRGRRFRVHVFPQRNGVTALFQLGRSSMMALRELGLPEALGRFTSWDSGLVLITGGPTSGKSTTVHALIDRMNRTSMRHIITLEHSLEVVHQPVLSAITQREIGRHAKDLGLALKASLREDPDVIVIDDLKDFDSISFALTAAETGHLVLGVMQQSSVQAGVERIIKAFPASQHETVQGILAGSLRAALCQRLLPRQDGQGRVAAAELLINNSAAQNLIRKGKTVQIPTLIATSADVGMQTMDADITRRTREGLVEPPRTGTGVN